MTVERLGDYLQASFPKKSLRKIYLAHQLKEKIKALTGEDVRVTIRPGAVVINCRHAAQATALRARERQLYAATSQLLPPKTVLRFRVG